MAVGPAELRAVENAEQGQQGERDERGCWNGDGLEDPPHHTQAGNAERLRRRESAGRRAT